MIFIAVQKVVFFIVQRKNKLIFFHATEARNAIGRASVKSGMKFGDLIVVEQGTVRLPIGYKALAYVFLGIVGRGIALCLERLIAAQCTANDDRGE